MFANRLLVLGALCGLVVGCGHDDRANAVVKAPASPPPAAAPVAAPKHAAKQAPRQTTVRHVAAKPAAKPAVKSTSNALALNVPEAHLPPAGQCRIWKQGTSVFKQPQAESCDGITRAAPAGSMILERSAKDTKLVRVRYVDASRAGHVVRVRVFEAASGKYVRDEKV